MILGVVIGLELHAGVADEDMAAGVTSPASVLASADEAPSATNAWVATILSRPVFSPSRAPAATATVATASALPRLAGIMVIPGRRNAIFYLAGGAPVVTPEGGRIGPYTVREIRRESVVVDGPHGLAVLHTSFAASGTGPQAPAPADSPDDVVDGITGTPGGIWLNGGSAALPNAATWAGVPPLNGLPVQRPATAGPTLTPPGG